MKNIPTLLLASVLLSSCASTPSQDGTASEAAAQAAAAAAEEAGQQAQRARELAEQQAREAAEADRRYLELEAQVREQEQEGRRAQAAADGSQSQDAAATIRSASGGSGREREQAVTQQQARIAELRAQVAANKAETVRIDSANSALREAIAAAEALTAVLAAEQEKYKGADPATGQTQGDLSKAEIEELTAEVARLRALAAELGAKQANP
jgi:hypothetical protein